LKYSWGGLQQQDGQTWFQKNLETGKKKQDKAKFPEKLGTRSLTHTNMIQ
jgi:hypothetical protein